jgi:hypothetical protein
MRAIFSAWPDFDCFCERRNQWKLVLVTSVLRMNNWLEIRAEKNAATEQV